jgi:hypothetical protein
MQQSGATPPESNNKDRGFRDLKVFDFTGIYQAVNFAESR